MEIEIKIQKKVDLSMYVESLYDNFLEILENETNEVLENEDFPSEAYSQIQNALALGLIKRIADDFSNNN